MVTISKIQKKKHFAESVSQLFWTMKTTWAYSQTCLSSSQSYKSLVSSRCCMLLLQSSFSRVLLSRSSQSWNRENKCKTLSKIRGLATRKSYQGKIGTLTPRISQKYTRGFCSSIESIGPVHRPGHVPTMFGRLWAPHSLTPGNLTILVKDKKEELLGTSDQKEPTHFLDKITERKKFGPNWVRKNSVGCGSLAKS